MHTFATPAPIHVDVQIPAGRIQVIGADRADTAVEIRPANPTKSRDVKAAERTTVDFTEATVHIHTRGPANQYLGPTGAVEITVQVPAGSPVTATTSGSEIRGVGRLGELTVTGAYRHIKIDEAASVHLTALDGDIEIGRLHGPATITTARGAIRIAEATTGALELRTQRGEITLGATPGASASLDAGTGHGRIHNALKNNGTPELHIHATTGHGDITARSL